MNFVITGGTGWIGRNIIDHLVSGIDLWGSEFTSDNHIYALYQTSENKTELINHSQITWIKGDLRDENGLDRLFERAGDSILLHLAATIHPSLLTKEFIKVNVEGTRRLLTKARKTKINKAIILSSNSAIGCNPTPEHRFTELSAYNPYMGYGYSKFFMETYIQSIIDTDFAVPITMIRAPWFYGPHQPPRQKQFFEMIRKGKVPIVGSGLNKRSMVFVSNLVQGILLAAVKSEANNEIFWIADESPYSFREILDTVEELMQTEFSVQCKGGRLWLPDCCSDISYVVDWLLQRFGVYNQKVHVLSELNKTIACDITKAKERLGYRPQFSLREGMRQSLAEIYS